MIHLLLPITDKPYNKPFLSYASPSQITAGVRSKPYFTSFEHSAYSSDTCHFFQNATTNAFVMTSASTYRFAKLVY